MTPVDMANWNAGPSIPKRLSYVRGDQAARPSVADTVEKYSGFSLWTKIYKTTMNASAILWPVAGFFAVFTFTLNLELSR